MHTYIYKVYYNVLCMYIYIVNGHEHAWKCLGGLFGTIKLEHHTHSHAVDVQRQKRFCQVYCGAIVPNAFTALLKLNLCMSTEYVCSTIAIY